MKTIIIPARNSESATKLFHISQQLYRHEPVNYWFLSIRPIPSDYNDLLTLGRVPSGSSVFDIAFNKTIDELIGTKNGRVTYHTDHIYGDSPYVFRNYLKFREADLVVYDKHEWRNSRKETGLNVFRMVSQCGCEFMYVSGDSELVSDNNHNNDDPVSSQPLHNTPASVQYQFQAVTKSLAGLEKNMQAQKVISVRYSHLSRYFLKEDALQKIMVQADCSLLLLHK